MAGRRGRPVRRLFDVRLRTIFLTVLPQAALGRSGFLRAKRVLSLTDGVTGDALWWQDGVIRLVGVARELERQVPTRVPRIDLPRTTVTPGIVDGHTHFGLWALGQARVSLVGAASRAEALSRIAAGSPEQGWLRGHGWDANHWEAVPDRWALDGATGSFPAAFDSVDVHALWANSRALQAAGITRASPDLPGGRIVRDGNGEPTGLLLEHAADPVRAVLPAPEPGRMLAAMENAQRAAHRLGIVGIHDIEGPEALRAFRRLEEEDRLRLRVLFHPPVAQLEDLLGARVRSGTGTPWLALGGVKLFFDGTLGSRTAWMLDPYEDGGDRGMPLTAPEAARQAVQRAAGGGIALVIHAIGDAAVRRALDLLAEAPRVALPHRIEHLQCVHPADLSRPADLGVVASMQPSHLPGDAEMAEARWGARARGAYAFRSLEERGTLLAFGSDAPVTHLDPRLGLAAAMDRNPSSGRQGHSWNPEERLSFESALRAYTVGNATAGALEHRRGRVAPGFDADFVAWEMDAAVERGVGSAMKEARVRMTVVDGQIVWTQ
jgi:predicted amidohydrolase YtcJ